MKKIFSAYEYSLRRLWNTLLVVLLFSMVAIFLFLMHQQQSKLLQSTAESQFDSLSKFSSQLTDGLAQAEDYLYSSFYGNENIFAVRNASDTLEQYKAKQELSDLLDRVVQLNEFVEAAWFYQAGDTADSPSDIFLSRNNYTGITIREIKEMKQLLAENLSDPASSSLLSGTGWNLVLLEDEYYLLWTAPVEDSFCGAWVSVSYLYSLLQDRTLISPSGQDFICDLQGNSLISGNDPAAPEFPEGSSSWISFDRQTIHIGVQLEAANLTLQKVIKSKELLQASSSLQQESLVFILFFLVTAIVIGIYHFLIYRPFQQMLTNMNTIHFDSAEESGNRLPVEGHFSDIRILSTSINQLLDKNQDLNRKIFDSEIRERDVQVQYLQIRLKAHFYMNGLSLIHAMSRMGQNSLIQELSQCLIEYLRFIDVDTQKFVRLRDELNHVQSYARIQELRFPDLFQYTEDVSAELYDASIPPLVLQTFVENSIEHGMRQGENYRIKIKIFFEEINCDLYKCL